MAEHMHELEMPHHTLNAKLLELKRRLLLIGLGSGVGWAGVGALCVVVGSAWADLAVDLPSELRLTAGIVAGLTSLTILIWVLISRRRGTSSLATALDRAGDARGQITSGVDLMRSPPRGGSLTSALSELAVDRAEALARVISVSSAGSARPLFRAATGFFVPVILIVITSGWCPRLAQTLWLRFIDPFGDHPPFSRSVLEIEPGSAQVLYGGDVDVVVQTSGPPVERVDLVLRSKIDGAIQSIPMFPGENSRWRTTLTNVTTPTSFYARANATRSHLRSVDVILVPRIESIRCRVTPPSYTRLGSYEGPLPSGGLAGLIGTHVEVVARSNRPLSSGVVTLTSEGEIRKTQLAAYQANEVKGSFEILRSGRLQLEVIDVAGERSRDSSIVPITLLTDERPMIRIEEPPPVSLATPDVVLPVVLSAEDDYGVTRVQLFRSLNESRPLAATISALNPPATRHICSTTLPLGEYKLQPGDVIKLFGRAEDNDPAGNKGSESEIAVVQIISESDYERIMLSRQGLQVLQSKYDQARRRMESIVDEVEKLSKEMEKAPSEGELSKDLRAKLDQLSDKMKKESAEIAKSAKRDLGIDVDQSLKKQLEKLAKDLAATSQDAKDAASKPGMTGSQARKALANMHKQLQDRKREYEQEASEPLEHLAKVYPLKVDEARFVAIYQRQRNLAERMASIKGHDGTSDPSLKSRMRDLEEEQKQVRESLNDLLQDIRDHVEQLPEDPSFDQLRSTAKKFLKAAKACGAVEDMSEVETALAEFSGTRAHEGALAAADALEKLISKCNGMGNKACQSMAFNPKLNSCLGNSVEQLLSMSGMGSGPAGTNGYSMNQNTPQNVGLYGDLPQAADDRSGHGEDNAATAARGRGGRGAEGSGTVNPRWMGARSPNESGTEVVPTQYRRRVGQYFQRLADEIGDKDRPNRR